MMAMRSFLAKRTLAIAALIAIASPALAETAPTMSAAALPHELSPWSMFLAADWVVKAVMVGLVAASLMVWTVWLAKTIELILAKAALRRSQSALSSARSLMDGRRAMQQRRGFAAACIAAVDEEINLSSDTIVTAGIESRAASRIAQIEATALRAMRRGTGLIATVGSTAPFVGLFGTVWGIMNSFVGISKAQTSNLAVVAPGIAEALLATALGLVAAIPAVVLYNQLARATAGYKALAGENAAAILRLLSRDLDRGRTAHQPHLRAAE